MTWRTDFVLATGAPIDLISLKLQGAGAGDPAGESRGALAEDAKLV
jgi:hypothetical protein